MKRIQNSLILMPDFHMVPGCRIIIVLYLLKGTLAHCAATMVIYRTYTSNLRRANFLEGPCCHKWLSIEPTLVTSDEPTFLNALAAISVCVSTCTWIILLSK